MIAKIIVFGNVIDFMSTTVKLMSAIAKSVDIKDCVFKKIKNEVLFFF
nr:MAG TPA: hypothetical protein [Caudoviricetes sp.]